jgi:hypothetical protein
VRLVRISPFPSCNQLTPNTDFPRNFPMKCSAPGSSLAVREYMPSVRRVSLLSGLPLPGANGKEPGQCFLTPFEGLT